MATRPEEENPMQKARRRQEELKALGRGQLWVHSPQLGGGSPPAVGGGGAAYRNGYS